MVITAKAVEAIKTLLRLRTLLTPFTPAAESGNCLILGSLNDNQGGKSQPVFGLIGTVTASQCCVSGASPPKRLKTVPADIVKSRRSRRSRAAIRELLLPFTSSFQTGMKAAIALAILSHFRGLHYQLAADPCITRKHEDGENLSRRPDLHQSALKTLIRLTKNACRMLWHSAPYTAQQVNEDTTGVCIPDQRSGGDI